MYRVLVTFATNCFNFHHTTTLFVFDPNNVEYITECINDQLEQITIAEMLGIHCTHIIKVEILSSPKKNPGIRF